MENQSKLAVDKGRNAGRWVIGAMVVGCTLMSVFFYQALKRAPEYKNLVTEQMQIEFVNYMTTVKGLQELKVAEFDQAPKPFSYVVDVKGPWKFEIQDQLLLVTAPPIRPENAGLTPPLQQQAEAQIPQIQGVAQKSIEDFIMAWLIDKFHNDKDLRVQVVFAPTAVGK